MNPDHSRSAPLARASPVPDVEARLEACRSELERLRREFDGFSYAVAHDLRAPLRAVTGFLEALQEDHAGELTTPARGYLQRAIDSAIRSQRMVEVLLQLSRLGRQALEAAPTPLGDLVEDVRRELALEAPGRDIEWRIGPLPVVDADGRLLREALRCLLENAVKFTRRQPRAVIEVASTSGPSLPVVTIRDNGTGFNAARAEHLFQPFARYHSQQDFEGLGAGLAIAESVVRKHGGRLWVESEEGRGAAFHFTLGAEESPAERRG